MATCSGQHYLISFVLVVLLTGTTQALIPFQGRSFALRATVTHLNSSLELDRSEQILWSQTVEKYSADQSRASISFKLRNGLSGKLEPGDLYHDSEQKQTLHFGMGTCRLVEANKVKLLPNLDVNELELDATSNHVIGLARLMLFVEHHKDKLKMVGSSLKKRNLITLEYTYNDGNDIHLNIYYSGLALSQDPDSMPIQIIVTSKQQIALVDFSQVHLETISTNYNIGQPQDVYVDNYAYPKECLNQLASNWVEILFQKTLNMFSFQSSLSFSTSLSANRRRLVSKVNYCHSLDTVALVFKEESSSKVIKHKKVANFKTKRAYQVLEVVGSDKQVKKECLLFKISSINGKHQSTSEILTGANQFVYLGHAEVRGTRTRLYAAVNNTMPPWLEQPVEYTYHGINRVRDPLNGVADSLITLIYVDNNKQILQMELHRLNGTKITVQLFDFVWDLEHSGSDLFSLHQDCANLDESKHARVEMLLSKLDGKKFSELPSKSMLESRLMAVLQEDMFIPATMVYDLEIKILREKDLFVSFNVAAHGEEVVNLVYLGLGDSKFNLTSKTTPLTTMTNSFQICFQIAVKHQKPFTKIFFGYSRETKRCRIAVNLDAFIVYDRATKDKHDILEIYTAESSQSNVMVYGGQDGRWLEGSGREWYRRKFIGLRVVLDTFQEDNRYFWFQIKRLKVDSLGKIGLPDRLYIHGFGLLNDDSKKDTQLAFGEMTLSKCRSGCLANDSCQSYSVCQRPQGIECILSPLNFKSINTLKQLADLAEESKSSNLNSNDKNNVILDDKTSVSLKKHSNCDLYNKLYLDLFELAGKSWQSQHSKQKIMAVTSEEECAKVCVQLNLEVLSRDVELRSKLALSKDNLDKIMTDRKENNEYFCGGFLYMERSQVENEEKLMKILELSEEDLKVYVGYCSLEVDQKLQKNDATSPWPQATVDSIRFSFTRFKFNLIHFYTSQRGVHLSAGQVLLEDKSAYYLAQRQRFHSLSKTAHDRLRLLAESGNNFQEMHYMDELKCAYACFFGKLEQVLGPWPSCQSFDVFYDERSGRKQCYLNSISLQEAVNHSASNSYIDVSSNQSTWTLWTHYEPSFLTSLNAENILEAQLELEKVYLSKDESLGIVNGFALVLISWLAVLGGIFIGVKLGHRIVPILRSNGVHGEHERVSLSFDNQVNDHRIIVD